MINVVVYKKNGITRAAINDVIFYDQHENRLYQIVANYAKNIGEDAVLFYRENEEFPFMTKAFARKEI